ncbi:MAG: mechanosensitive ion channel family protein [Sphingobacterium sp.]|uniref:mechanosensitive ion channel family protein n=1 Tax=Sphingobacterium sp. JB170 TaxID=1434842 RepID=UPI00097F546E|nr:mechanosensitive ion channel domain-containing protein [Sphingobacterium sp. JB170]SJN18594.1 Potassium efflux system KefA protein / Small-conductance mechanosensitive channel [Sphingobacterium sp. JB170]
MISEKKRRNSHWQFIVKIILWILLNISFIYFGTFYNEHNFVDRFSNALNLFLSLSIIFSLGRFVLIVLYNKRHEQRIVRGNFVLGVNRLTAVLNTTVGVIAIMIAVGIDPRDFVTSLTIVAMAIAVIFREYITNMISGLLIMFSDQLSVGDRVKIGDHNGRIIDITLTSLIIQDDEDDMVMVPNNMIFVTAIVNSSAHRSALVSIRFELPLDLAIDIDLLQSCIQDILLNHPNLVDETPPEIMVLAITKDAVRCKLDIRAISSSNSLHRQLENEVLKKILKFKAQHNR